MPKVFRGGSINGCELGERIGAGAYSCVFAAGNMAVKVYNSCNEDLHYFLNEITILRKLGADNPPGGIVRLHQTGIETHWEAEVPRLHAFLVFDRHQTTLAKYMRREKLTEKDAVEVSRQLISALEFVHSAGIIHGDIKPSNILFNVHGANGAHIVLADFGTSLKIGQPAPWCVGTVPYLPPEFLLEHNAIYGPESDIWSVVLTFYFIFTGVNLFDVDGLSGYHYSDYIEMPDVVDGLASTSSEDEEDDSSDDIYHSDNAKLLAIIYAFLGRPPKKLVDAPLFDKYYTSRRNVRDYPQSLSKMCDIYVYIQQSMIDENSTFAKHVSHDSSLAIEYCDKFADLILSGLKYQPSRRDSLAIISRKLLALAN